MQQGNPFSVQGDTDLGVAGEDLDGLFRLSGQVQTLLVCSLLQFRVSCVQDVVSTALPLSVGNDVGQDEVLVEGHGVLSGRRINDH